MTNECATASRPSLRHRFWRALGFGRNDGWLDLSDWRSEDPKEGFAFGAMLTETYVYFDFWDRVRVLVSGKCEVHVWSKTDKIINRAESRSFVRVLSPDFPVRKP